MNNRLLKISAIFATFILFFYLNVRGQNLYQLDLTDPTTYSITCGTVTPSQWSVKDNFCHMTTSVITYPGNPSVDPPMIAPVTITLRSTGNLDCTEVFPDGAFVKVSVNYGPWFSQNSVPTCMFKVSTQYTSTFNLYAPAGAAVRIMIILANNSKTEKIWVQQGEIVVGPASIATPGNWVKTATFNEERANSLTVFPNPSNGYILGLNLENTREERIKLSLYNRLGKEVLSKELFVYNGILSETLALQERLSPDVYLLVLSGKNELYRQRLLVQ